MNIDWLEDLAKGWRDRREAGRVPHALMLTGPQGVGKRAAAAWLAATQLGIEAGGAVPQYPAPELAHADLRWLRPLPDKSTIGIEQVRELVAELGLTSYAGAGKVAVLEPANAMTANAANSLLKTLEEPPGDALLILVADRHGRLPATIFSRCQRLDILPPGEAEALRWLDRVQPGVAWAEALALAGGAPLAAIAALEALEAHAAMARDFRAVAAGSASALDVAGRWASGEPAVVLDWLARQVQQAVRRTAGAAPVAGACGVDESVLQRMDRRNLFCYLDTINRLRGQPAGSYNVQLAFECLLIDWAEGLVNVRSDTLRPLQTLATR